MGNYKRNRSKMKLLILPILAKLFLQCDMVNLQFRYLYRKCVSTFPSFCHARYKYGIESIDRCQDENQALFKPKRFAEVDLGTDRTIDLTQSCSCVDPLTGDVTEGQDCMLPCPGEAGNTCKEQRKKDME